MTSYFSDAFGRTTGPNDVGNSWTAHGSPTTYETNGSAAVVTGSSFDTGILHAIGSTLTDWEILVRFQTTNGAEVLVGVHNGTQSYSTKLQMWANQYEVREDANFFWNSSTQATAHPTTADNTFYWFRMQYIGGVIKTRYWADGAGEPGTWDTSFTPATAYSNFTHIMLGCWGTGGTAHFSDVEITNGAAALIREQEGYRWRNDDGSETTATWKAAQDTAASVAPQTALRLRTLVNVTGDAPSESVKLQYRKVGDTTWENVLP